MWGGLGIYTVDAGYIWWMRDKNRAFGDKASVLGGCVAIKSYIFIYKF